MHSANKRCRRSQRSVAKMARGASGPALPLADEIAEHSAHYCPAGAGGNDKTDLLQGMAFICYLPAATRSINRPPRVITRSPGARPLSTSTVLPLASPDLIRCNSIAFSLSLSRTTQTSGGFALVNDGIARDRDRLVAFTGEDLHAREHFRLEQSGVVVDGRAHQQPPDRWIECRSHV